ncbi:hypothetical protein [Streptomyces xantholiticus]|uniref:Uncharacterized protein n=1 Tax=Streptomyces xantholiticus TaxID=68285 RepID=A0ABV1UQU0_9ACTN
MASPALDAAVDRIRTVFAGMTSPAETGCGMCHLPSETALLRTPGAQLPDDVLRMFAHEVPSHFDDHRAVMRRILPQLAEQLADGRFAGLDAYDLTGLGRSGWQSWPGEQAGAVADFLHAWWTHTLSTQDEPWDAMTVFQACVTASSTVTPYLARWAEQPVGGRADACLELFAEWWIDELLDDRTNVVPWWCDHTRDEPLPELQAWILEHAPARLFAREADQVLLFKVGLLALPHEQRFTEETWSRAPA